MRSQPNAMPPCGGGPNGERVEQEAELLALLAPRPSRAARRPAPARRRGGYGSTRRRSRCRCRRCRRRRPARSPGRPRTGRSTPAFGEVNGWCTAVQPSSLPLSSLIRSNIGASTTQTNDQALSSISPHRRAISPRAAPSSARASRRVPGGEEDRVARLGAGGLGQPVALGVGEVLGHRAAERAVLADGHVGQPAGAALLGPLLPGVELPARLARPARHHDRADVRGLEHPERGVGEVLGEVGELDGEPQVGLVRAVAGHRLGVGHARDRPRDLVADQLRHSAATTASPSSMTSSCVDEAHLDVELGELRLPVGAEVLVAVAAGDLVVALRARRP